MRGKNPPVALMFLRTCHVDIKSFVIVQLYNFWLPPNKASIVFTFSGKATQHYVVLAQSQILIILNKLV